VVGCKIVGHARWVLFALALELHCDFEVRFGNLCVSSAINSCIDAGSPLARHVEVNEICPDIGLRDASWIVNPTREGSHISCSRIAVG
jgi:hypothetical protein